MGCCVGRFESRNSSKTIDVWQGVHSEIVAAGLKGKCYAITGTTTGTGYWTALTAAEAGANVMMLNRKSERADAAQKSFDEVVPQGSGGSVVTVECDLQSFASVRKAAEEVSAIAAKCGGLDGLINNAGVMAQPDVRTVDGYEVQMQSNHLSHFLLTKLLLPSLKQGAASRGEARVVQHSSGARSVEGTIKSLGVDGNLESKFFEKSEPGTLGQDSLEHNFNRYHQTKLSNTVFAMALHKLLASQGSKVKSVVAEPGFCVTALADNVRKGHHDAGNNVFPCIVSIWSMSVAGDAQSGQDGACPLMLASFSPRTNSGDCWMPKEHDGDMDKISCYGQPIKCIEGGIPSPKEKWIEEKFQNEKLTMDQANQALLWTKSVEAVGETWENPQIGA